MNIEFRARYSFDTFVVGSGNRSAYDAAQAMLQRFGRVGKPVVLCGGAGAGKKHLMQAIEHEVKRRSPERAVGYLNLEAFTNELICSIKREKVTRYFVSLSRLDVLLIDDIQFLARKVRTQQTFAQLIGELLRQGKQIVAGGCLSKKEFGSLLGELNLNIDSWQVVEISCLDFETMLAILHRKANSSSITIPDNCLRFIAANVHDIRKLEGILTLLSAYASLMKTPICLQMAQRMLAA